MEKKHAYLIMAHHCFDVLEELLKDLDDERNNIFLHVDIKSKDFYDEHFAEVVKRAKLILIERMDIHWGGYSQIKCVMQLLKVATNYDVHSYYHFMVGVEFPLKTQDNIHDFFAANEGYEFIGFDNKNIKYIERVQYYHFFNEYARNNNFIQKVLNKLRIWGVKAQKIMKVNLCKKYEYVFKKGYANWSITHELASYIVTKEKEINKMYKHSFCGDEVFIHTLVYNSKFWKKVFDYEDEYRSAMRITTWENDCNRFSLDDLDVLLNSGRLFARKIDGTDALKLIECIKEARGGK